MQQEKEKERQEAAERAATKEAAAQAISDAEMAATLGRAGFRRPPTDSDRPRKKSSAVQDSGVQLKREVAY